MVKLYSHQLEAVEQMKNGCILCADVGTGKSRTALLYFYTKVCGGSLKVNGSGKFREPTAPRDLYIITTAKKRDSHEWLDECVPFCLSEDPSKSVKKIKVTVDSWNNIKKYSKINSGFFIFDEQRVSGWGAWSKTFVRIAQRNQWILLSATPGDKWTDYIPVFIANGFYKTKGEFEREHCVYSPYLSFPKIEKYVNVSKLNNLRSYILVRMVYEKTTVPMHINVQCRYDKEKYRTAMRHWDPYKDEPIENPSELCYILRKVVNSDNSRITKTIELVEEHKKAIIFYNFDYELEKLETNLTGLTVDGKEVVVRQWNGHKHEPVPTTSTWVYLVQYNSASEGWNCTSCDTIIFYSQNYSYRMSVQAAGRIDRMNSPYKDLYFYHLKSSSKIDLAIARALSLKKDFNENAYLKSQKLQGVYRRGK